MNKIKATWKSGYAFEQEANDFRFITDASYKEQSPSGPGPKILLLSGLAGCTGIDIVSLLEKMRVDITDLTIEVSADLTDEHPKIYKDIHIVYSVKGPSGKRDKVVKAIEMSMDRYCGVSAMLAASSRISYDLDYTEG